MTTFRSSSCPLYVILIPLSVDVVFKEFCRKGFSLLNWPHGLWGFWTDVSHLWASMNAVQGVQREFPALSHKPRAFFKRSNKLDTGRVSWCHLTSEELDSVVANCAYLNQCHWAGNNDVTKMMLIVCPATIPVTKIYWFELIQGVGFSLGGKWGHGV